MITDAMLIEFLQIARSQMIATGELPSDTPEPELSRFSAKDRAELEGLYRRARRRPHLRIV